MQSRGCHLDRMAAAFGRAKTRLWLEIKASIYDCPILAPRRAGVWCARLGDACVPRGWAFFRTSSQWFLSSSGMMARSRRASLVGAIPEDAIIV
jgi:hypothetical protein